MDLVPDQFVSLGDALCKQIFMGITILQEMIFSANWPYGSKVV